MRFNKEQADFLKKELNVDLEPEKDFQIGKEEWFKIQDRCFEIESDEVVRAGNGNALSARGQIAMSFCDMAYTN